MCTVTSRKNLRMLPTLEREIILEKDIKLGWLSRIKNYVNFNGPFICSSRLPAIKLIKSLKSLAPANINPIASSWSLVWDLNCYQAQGHNHESPKVTYQCHGLKDTVGGSVMFRLQAQQNYRIQVHRWNTQHLFGHQLSCHRLPWI